jgi:hypothetical protein
VSITSNIFNKTARPKYHDGDELKGEVDLNYCAASIVSPSDADNKPYAFQVIDKKTKNQIILCTANDQKEASE